MIRDNGAFDLSSVLCLQSLGGSAGYGVDVWFGAKALLNAEQTFEGNQNILKQENKHPLHSA